MANYLSPFRYRRADSAPQPVSWYFFRVSYWLRWHRVHVRASESAGNPEREYERARNAALPPAPVIDPLNGAFFSGSRWQRPP